MTPEEFIIHLSQFPEKIREEFEAVKEPIAKVAIDHFTENFEKEGFVNSTLEPWQEVKRRMDPRVKGARATRKILIGDTGNLKRSIDKEFVPEGILIYSDTPYASAHNEGTDNAGRGHSTHIPKRQFIGDSKELDEKVKVIIETRFDKLFNNL
jgi:phage gpG-like protein